MLHGAKGYTTQIMETRMGRQMKHELEAVFISGFQFVLSQTSMEQRDPT